MAFVACLMLGGPLTAAGGVRLTDAEHGAAETPPLSPAARSHDATASRSVLGFVAVGSGLGALLTVMIGRGARRWRTAGRRVREHQSIRRALDQHTIVTVTDRRGVIVDVNQPFCDISGYRRDELIGRTHAIVNSGAHSKAFWRDMWATIARGEVWRAEVCNRAKDGSLYWVDSTIIPQLDDRGRIERYVSLRSDITEKKIGERDNQVLLVAFDASPVATVMTDLDGNVLYANPAAVALDADAGLWLRAGHPALVFDPAFVDPADAASVLVDILAGHRCSKRLRVQRQPFGVPGLTAQTPLDEPLWIEVIATPVVRDGDIVGILFSKRDVTSEVQAEADEKIRAAFADTRIQIASVLGSPRPMRERLRRALALLLKPLPGQKRDNGTRGASIVGVSGGGETRVIAGVGASLSGDDALTTPLERDGETYGQIMVRSDRVDAFVRLDPHALELLAEPFAGALARRHANQQVREASREMERLAERAAVATRGAGVGIWEYDPTSGSLTWDAMMHDIYDVPEDGGPLAFTDWRSRVHPDDADAAVAALEETIDGRAPFDTTFRVIRSNGEVRYVSATATVIRDPNGAVRRVIGVNWDRTAEVEAINAMHEAQRLGGLASWRYDVAEERFTGTAQLASFLRRSDDDAWSTREILRAISRADRRRLHAELRALGTGAIASMRVRFTCDGAARFGHIVARARRDHAGRVTQFYGTCLDVTRQVEREAALAEIAAALEASNDSVFMFDAETLRFVYANRGATEHAGRPLEELRRRSLVDLTPDLTHDDLRSMLAPLRAKPHDSLVLRTEHEHSSGRRAPVEVSLQFIPGLGRTGRFIAIVRDISERFEVERRLLEAKEAAEEASRTKSEFLANMSHEIRTPMTAIVGYADLLTAGEGADPAEAGAAIRRAAGHLLGVINDILDVSKIEAGRLEVERIPAEPRSIVEDVAELVRHRAATRDVEVVVDYGEDIPRRIVTDPMRLRQILVNLAGNAVKFTEKGEVRLTVMFDHASNRIGVSIKDTGIGMTPEQLRIVRRFEAFTQADSSLTRKFGGTGLGLRISYALAVLLGGTIEVDAIEGRGSEFRVWIDAGEVPADAAPEPVAAANPTHAAGDDAPPLANRRVLIAEDGVDNQRLITLFLEKAGAEVTVCENGRVAVETIVATPPASMPDLILMDMQMPEMDGYTATRRLRDMAIDLPIVALTAHAMDRDRQRCLDAGCSDYLSKPIDRHGLITACARWVDWLDRQRARPAA